jgi:hypothetical protein
MVVGVFHLSKMAKYVILAFKGSFVFVAYSLHCHHILNDLRGLALDILTS